MANTKTEVTKSNFDAREVEIREALKARLEQLKPIGAPPKHTDVFDGVVEIDSKLVATEVRPIVEKLMGAEFPLKLIKKGGYPNATAAVDHLIEGLRTWCVDDAAHGAGVVAQ